MFRIEFERIVGSDLVGRREIFKSAGPCPSYPVTWRKVVGRFWGTNAANTLYLECDQDGDMLPNGLTAQTTDGNICSLI